MLTFVAGFCARIDRIWGSRTGIYNHIMTTFFWMMVGYSKNLSEKVADGDKRPESHFQSSFTKIFWHNKEQYEYERAVPTLQGLARESF